MIFNLFIFYIILVFFNRYTLSYKPRLQIYTHRYNTNNLFSQIEDARYYNNQHAETVRGAQCYLPPEQRIQRWLQNKWQEASKKFGFQEYSMPVLTHSSMFINSTTPMNDEHFKEMYTFNDKKGRNLCLRGDITPQFMHMIQSLNTEDSLIPLNTHKWYTIADCWRYERPSYCRRRNHTQWNVDVIGINNLNVELDILSLLIYFFKSVGLSENDVKISINHRNFTQELLKHLGIENYSLEWFYKFCKILDKYKKTERNDFDQMLNGLDLSTAQCAELHKIIESSKSINDLENFIHSHDLAELKKLLNELDNRGHLNWIDIDLTIVRGNDYYTGIVFECFDRDGVLPRSLAGGGRYDNYFNDSDSVLRYSAGFGMGNIAVTNLLKLKHLIPESARLADVLVFTGDYQSYQNESGNEGEFGENISENHEVSSTNDQLKRNLFNLTEFLRNNELSVYHYYKTSKVKKALRFAERWMVPFFIMPVEHDGKPAIILKNLLTRSQEYFDPEDDELCKKVLDNINTNVVN